MQHGNFENPFDINQVPLSDQPITRAEQPKKSLLTEEEPTKKDESLASKRELLMQTISSIPTLANLGPLFKSSGIIELTESVSEYNVSCFKHVFPKKILLQFDCLNTLNDQLLEDVKIVIEPVDESEEGDPWIIEKVIPIDSLSYNQPGSTYALLSMPEDGRITGNFNATLKFRVRDVDPATGEPESPDGYDNVYVLEPIEISVVDFVFPTSPQGSFTTAWDKLGNTCEVDETYALSSVNTLEEAVKSLTKCMGMMPCEHSDRIIDGKSSHTLLLSGIFKGGIQILSRIRMAIDPVDLTITINIVVRSTDETVSLIFGNIIG